METGVLIRRGMLGVGSHAALAAVLVAPDGRAWMPGWLLPPLRRERYIGKYLRVQVRWAAGRRAGAGRLGGAFLLREDSGG